MKKRKMTRREWIVFFLFFWLLVYTVAVANDLPFKDRNIPPFIKWINAHLKHINTRYGAKSCSSIYDAIQQDDLDAAKRFLAERPEDANVVALQESLDRKRLSIAKLIIVTHQKHPPKKKITCDDFTWRMEKLLFEFLENDDVENVEFLLKAGMDVNVVRDGETPLHISVRRKNGTMTALLIKKGADINSRIKERKYALPSDTDMSSVESSRILLGVKTLPETKTCGSLKTPLHIAAESGDLEIVKLLLKNGAGTCLKDKHGKTPLYYAKKYGYMKTAKILEEYGGKM